MFIKFEPSGTKIWNGRLKIRLDLYPEPTDKVYQSCLVTVDEAGNPITPQLNPCLCHFITVEPTLTASELDTLVRNTFLKDDLTILDELLLDARSNIREIGLRMLAKKGSSRISPQLQDVADVNARLKDVVVTNLNTEGQRELPEDTAIDVGAGATDRASTRTAGNTSVDFNNPANATGTIDTLQIQLVGTGNDTDVKMGFFYLVSGTTYHCRTGYDLGAIAAGSLITVSGLSLGITSGDFIGAYSATKQIERTASGGSGGRVYTSGEACDTGDEVAFGSADATAIMSLYGSGATAGAFGIEALTEAEKVYYEAWDGATLEGRTDVTSQSTEERAATLTAFKAAFPGDTYYQHNHHHNFPLATCTQVEV